MSTKEERIKSFNDSMNLIDTNLVLKDSLWKSISNQKVYLENDDTLNVNLKVFDNKANVLVTKDSSFDAARNYKDNHVAVLNFASATNPGGGVVKGSSAQEECLCRVSTLYKCINTHIMFNKFYTPHRKDGNVIHNDDIIYTPNIIIFKDDKLKLLSESDWKNVDIITCAAPNLRTVPNNGWCNIGESNTPVQLSDDKLLEIHKKRAKAILNSAVKNNADTIILGAFGCGAFKNKPEVVANAYKEVIKDYLYAFKNIEFAVFCNSYNIENYKIFKKIIEENK